MYTFDDDMIYEDMPLGPGDYYSIVSLYYYPRDNIFTDEDGNMINTYDYVNPNTLKLFLHNKESVVFENGMGNYIEMIYPDYDEPEIKKIRK